MIYNRFLKIDGVEIEQPTQYSVDFTDFEIVNTTEAGTTQRDRVRQSIPSISVSMQVTKKWLKTISDFLAKDSLTVEYLGRNGAETNAFYIKDFRQQSAGDTEYSTLWTVTFTLADMAEG